MPCIICFDNLFGNTQDAQGGGGASSSNQAAGNNNDDSDHTLAALPCGHVFHESCINDWLNHTREKTCLLCRRSVNGQPLRLFIEEDTSEAPLQTTAQSMVDVALVERQHTDIERLASRLSAADERNLNLQEQLEELQARFSVRDFEYTAEVQLTTRLREENAINSELLTQSHRRINNLETQCNARDESIRQLETRVASLQADLQDKSGALDARTKELKALQEDSQRQQTDYAELNLRYADKASKAESLEAQLASTTQAKNQLEDSILAIDSLMVEKEAEIAALKQSIGDLSKTNMSLQTKVFAGEAEAKLIQDQYSSLFINYTTRELDYAAEVTKSQSLAEEANAANSQRVQYERKIAELSVAITQNESHIRMLSMQLQNALLSANAMGSAAADDSHFRIQQLQEQYSQLEHRYVASFAEYKKELTRSQAFAAQLSSMNVLVAQRDYRVKELERTLNEKVAEIDLLQNNIDELTSDAPQAQAVPQ